MSRVWKIGIVVLAVLLMATTASAATISLVPDKTEVAPGEQFTLDIYVNGTNAKTVFLNFTYDKNLIAYVSHETYGVFTFTDAVVPGDGFVKYLGISTTNVDISGNPKVASVTFQVSDAAQDGDVIDFNVVQAVVDGNAATVEAGNVTVVVEPWCKFDHDKNGKINDDELLDAIVTWLNGNMNDDDLLDVIMKWLEF